VHRRLLALGLDVIGVVGFVALGRNSHAERDSLAGVLTVAAPFLVGLGVGWVIVGRTGRPAGMRAGMVVWGCTVIVGLTLRSVAFDRAVPPAFVVVAAAFLGLWLLGWRAASMILARRDASRPADDD
jgi:FtsH-binding integral membrane protein